MPAGSRRSAPGCAAPAVSTPRCTPRASPTLRASRTTTRGDCACHCRRPGRRHRRRLRRSHARRGPGAGDLGRAHAARAVVAGRLAVRRVGGRVDVESGFDGTRFMSSQTIVNLPTGTGEVNGLALLADGRIAMGISAPCDHCTPTRPYSASVVTFQPDGSNLQVEATGIRAPVGLAVFPSTGALLVTMDQRDDLGAASPTATARRMRLQLVRRCRHRSPCSTSTPRSAAWPSSSSPASRIPSRS